MDMVNDIPLYLIIIVSKGNHPKMAARFRLVKYDNLPRSIHI